MNGRNRLIAAPRNKPQRVGGEYRISGGELEDGGEGESSSLPEYCSESEGIVTEDSARESCDAMMNVIRTNNQPITPNCVRKKIASRSQDDDVEEEAIDCLLLRLMFGKFPVRLIHSWVELGSLGGRGANVTAELPLHYQTTLTFIYTSPSASPTSSTSTQDCRRDSV
jgi:hypothetical protein